MGVGENESKEGKVRISQGTTGLSCQPASPSSPFTRLLSPSCLSPSSLVSSPAGCLEGESVWKRKMKLHQKTWSNCTLMAGCHGQACRVSPQSPSRRVTMLWTALCSQEPTPLGSGPTFLLQHHHCLATNKNSKCFH